MEDIMTGIKLKTGIENRYDRNKEGILFILYSAVGGNRLVMMMMTGIK